MTYRGDKFYGILSQFGMREWLIAGGLVLVLFVLIDGYRRMRSGEEII